VSSQRVVIPGHLVPGLKGVALSGTMNPKQTLKLSIGLQLRNRSALDMLLTTQNDPQSKRFHHYLSPQQFAADFGPTISTTAAITAYLQSQGLHITSVASNHALIFAAGTVANIEKAFALTIAQYKYAGRTVYAPTSEPSVPASLGGIIANIVGLDDAVVWHRSDRPAIHRATVHTTAPQDPGSCTTAGGYASTQLRDLYDISPLVLNAYDGTGQYVALVEFDGYDATDTQNFDDCFGFTVFGYQTQYIAPGAPTTPTTAKGAEEASLDMEVLHETSPGAQEVLYLGNNLGADPYGNIQVDASVEIPVYAQIVTTPVVPTIVSSSWGIGCESDLNTAQQSQMDTLLAQGASEGIAFFEASGDTGPDECLNSGGTGVDFLSADPHVVAVGGTSYHVCQGCTESYWYTNNQLAGGYGTSTVFQEPMYQLPLGLSMRSVPDVSADADYSTGYAEYCYSGGLCSGWEVNGGTSAATPLWAGLAADINTYLNAIGRPTLGTASALLYQIGYNQSPYAAYHDITSGCYNGNPCAHRGFDAVTGIGSPDAWNLALDLQAQIATNLESDVVWGQRNNQLSITDLMFAYNQSSSPGWQSPVDVSQLIRNVTRENLNLNTNKEQPALVTYRTPGDGTEIDVYALVSVSNTPYGYSSSSVLYGFAYLPASGTWSDLGAVGRTGATQPAMNPVAVEVEPTNAPAPAVFGINGNGHVIEFYSKNGVRQSSGTPQPFSYTDISQQVGEYCDAGVAPAAVVYNSVPVVFADCYNTLVEFYPDSQGLWHANTGIVGHSIPNASHAFPRHSITAMTVPGSPASLEAYVASDQNGVKALSEYLYNGTQWAAYALPVASASTPDQVYAQSALLTNGTTTPISEVLAVDPASECVTLPGVLQYLYQPQLSNPAWHSTTLPTLAVTSAQAIVEQSGHVETEAFTGGYTGPSVVGSTGGAGCGDPYGGYIYENGSTVSSTYPQSWFASLVNSSRLDDEGVEPVGTEFPY
jgi:hypothetical protein